MLTRAFRAGTAGLVTLSMLLPQAGLAQALPEELAALAGGADLPRLDGVLQVCVLGDPAPCLLLDGAVAASSDEAALALAAGNGKAEGLARRLVRADARAMGAPEPEAAEAEPAPEAEEPETAEPAPEAVEPDAEPAPEAVAEPEPEVVESEPEPAPETAEPAPEVVEPEPAPETLAEPAPEVVEPDPEAEPAPEALAEPEPEPAPVEPEAEATAEEPLAPEAEAAVDPAVAARAERRATRAAERQAERAAELDAAREAAGRDASGETVEATDDAGLTEATAEAEAALQAEEQAAAPEVAAARGNGARGHDVDAEVVGAGDVRSSDEEIVRSTGDATAREESRRRGLSPLETIALLGIGALVIGALLDNGDEVVSTSNDRAVVRRPDGSSYVIKDDDTLLRRPGNTVETRRFDDGSTITLVTRQDGTQVQTISDATGRVLRRTKILRDGTHVQLFDDTRPVEVVDVSTLPRQSAPEVVLSGGDDLAEVLRRELAYELGRSFSLGQVRNIRAVREMMPIIDLDSITFDSGSAAIRASESDDLIDLGNAMRELIESSPGEVFLIEGHTDAVGSAASNLTLSDRRAESLALALTEYFDIPPENMVIQGYGESYLKVPTLADERANRRVAVRRITPLLVASN